MVVAATVSPAVTGAAETRRELSRNLVRANGFGVGCAASQRVNAGARRRPVSQRVLTTGEDHIAAPPATYLALTCDIAKCVGEKRRR